MKIILSIIMVAFLASCGTMANNDQPKPPQVMEQPQIIEQPKVGTDPFKLGGKVRSPGGCTDKVDC